MESQFINFKNGFDFDFFISKKKVFIIHGHDESNLAYLKNYLFENDLKPIILSEFDEISSLGIIERFEKVASKCKYAIALCTPDDSIQKTESEYFQPRPNVIYEIGWFCGKRSRNNIMILVKDKTEIFSDFQGVLQVRFENNVKEISHKLHKAFKQTGII